MLGQCVFGSASSFSATLFITVVTSMLTYMCKQQANLVDLRGLFFSSSLLCLSCSHCYAFPSAVSVRRSCSWKHPQSCIFVNWRGSGGGGCCEGRREGGGCQQIAWLTFQPQIIAWCKCTLAGLWVCMCVHRWARRLSETLISFSLRLVLWVLFKSVKHPKLKLIAVVHTLVCVV